MKLSDLITQAEAGRLVGVSFVTIWRWRRSGKIHTHAIGGRTFVSRREVELQARKKKAKR
jgi:predicted site-specific integrase-resolvase